PSAFSQRKHCPLESVASRSSPPAGPTACQPLPIVSAMANSFPAGCPAHDAATANWEKMDLHGFPQPQYTTAGGGRATPAGRGGCWHIGGGKRRHPGENRRFFHLTKGFIQTVMLKSFQQNVENLTRERTFNRSKPAFDAGYQPFQQGFQQCG